MEMSSSFVLMTPAAAMPVCTGTGNMLTLLRTLLCDIRHIRLVMNFEDLMIADLLKMLILPLPL